MTRTWQRLERVSLVEDYRTAAEDRFGDSIPWKWVEKILKDHGVPRHVYDEEGPESGLPPFGTAQVPTDALLNFLGY